MVPQYTIDDFAKPFLLIVIIILGIGFGIGFLLGGGLGILVGTKIQ